MDISLPHNLPQTQGKIHHHHTPHHGRCGHLNAARQERPSSSSIIFPPLTSILPQPKHHSSTQQQYSTNATTRIPYRIFFWSYCIVLHTDIFFAHRYTILVGAREPGP
jgi:hypothetical protein